MRKRLKYWNGKCYDARHGGAFDRGMADFWYHRPRDPHMYSDSTISSLTITKDAMTEEQIDDYHAGYSCGKADGSQKEY